MPATATANGLATRKTALTVWLNPATCTGNTFAMKSRHGRSRSQPYPPEYAKEGPEIIAKLEAKLALSDADLSATFVESNRYWYSELFGLGPRCDTCGQLNCKGHKNDLVVLAAWGKVHEDVPKGMVGVVACYGGRLRNGQYAGEEMIDLVRDAEETRPQRLLCCQSFRSSRMGNKAQHEDQTDRVGLLFSAATVGE